MSSLEILIEDHQRKTEQKQAKIEARKKLHAEINLQIAQAEAFYRMSSFPDLLNRLKLEFTDLKVAEEKKRYKPAHQIFTGEEINRGKGKIDPNFSLQVTWDYGKIIKGDKYPPHNEIDIHFFTNGRVEVHGGHILGKTILHKGDMGKNQAIQGQALVKAFTNPISHL